MVWTPITAEQLEFGEQLVEWILIARTQYGDDWLPTHADMAKSALLERIRAGLEPLDEPPPLGLSCPWYALIEDKGPHYVGGNDKWIFFTDGHPFGNQVPIDKAEYVNIFQNTYRVIRDFTFMGKYLGKIVMDYRHNTSYQFLLSYNGNYKPRNSDEVGGWFLQNLAYVVKEVK